MDDAELGDIARAENDDTFASITDLDSIGDTAVLAITFLLSAQVSLTTFVVGTHTLSGNLRVAFVVLALATMGLVFWSLSAVVATLLPVGFYSGSAGEVLLENPWLPLRRSTSDQFGFLETADSDPVEETPDGDDVPYRTVASAFVDAYSDRDKVTSVETYQFAKLAHYKRVGQRKAELTGLGLSRLRLAVLCFVVQFGVLFVGVLL